MTRPTFLSLFAGIGGLDLGLERAGWRCVGQVEIDPRRRAVLARHWPDVPRWGDIKEIDPDDLPRADLVCGGFPCQPFSTAGRRRGTGDERWGWPWMETVVRVVRPSFVLVENVAALLHDADAFGWLLGDLAALRFDAEWGVLSACAVGAPHTRERLFLVAYPHDSHGAAGLGIGAAGSRTIPGFDDRARAWRDSVAGALETSRADDRETDGSARWLVAAGGDAVVSQVAEHVGRLILQAHLSRAGAEGRAYGPPTSSSPTAPGGAEAPDGDHQAPALDRRIEARFWAKVNRNGPGGCWLWTAGRGGGGYGRFQFNGRPVPAHWTVPEHKRAAGHERAGGATIHREEVYAMSWGSPDHDHSDLSRAIDETRWNAERNVSELRDELYRVKQEIYNDLYGEIAGLREQVRELSGADA